MARVKHTVRKNESSQPKRLPRAKQEINCIRCKKTFTQRTNYLRHLGLIHRIDENEAPITEATYKRYAGYSKRKNEQPAKKVESEAARTDQPAEYAEADKPDSPPEVEPEAGPSVRIKVRPRLPGVRSIRARTKQLRTNLIALPKLKTTEYVPSRRRKELAPSVLAKLVAGMPNKSSEQIATELAAQYSWTTAEKRQRINVIRGMRAAERNLCTKIRRSLPFNRRTTNINSFLDQLEHDCQEIEARDSDEFV